MLRIKNYGESPLTPLHIDGEETAMTDILSRSFSSNLSWLSVTCFRSEAGYRYGSDCSAAIQLIIGKDFILHLYKYFNHNLKNI